MAAKKKGPRQIIGLKCTQHGGMNYVTEINKNNQQLKHQQSIKSFSRRKFCPTCRQHTQHKAKIKLK